MLKIANVIRPVKIAGKIVLTRPYRLYRPFKTYKEEERSSAIKSAYKQLEELLTKAGYKVEDIGILQLIRYCYNTEGGNIKREEFIEKALREESIADLVRRKYSSFVNAEKDLSKRFEVEGRFIRALQQKIAEQTGILAELKRKAEEEIRALEAKKGKIDQIYLVIHKPLKDSKVYLDEKTEFEAEAIGPPEKSKEVQEINRQLKPGEQRRLKFVWSVTGKPIKPSGIKERVVGEEERAYIGLDNPGERIGKAILENWLPGKASVEVELHDTQDNDKKVVESNPVDILIAQRDPRDAQFVELERIARHIYREIDAGNNEIMRIHDWLNENYPGTNYILKDIFGDQGNLLFIILYRGDLSRNPVCVAIPQLGKKLNKKQMNYFFDGYEKNMELKSDDVVQFARAVYNQRKDKYHTDKDYTGRNRIYYHYDEKSFEIVEKGKIRPSEKLLEAIKRIWEEEEKVLEALDKILEEEFPRAHKIIRALIDAIMSLNRENLSGASEEKINEILDRIMRKSEWSHQNMLRLIAWLKKLGEKLRLESVKESADIRNPTMRINLLKKRVPKRKLFEKYKLILKLAEMLEELEKLRKPMMDAVVGRFYKKPKPSQRFNLLGDGARIIPIKEREKEETTGQDINEFLDALRDLENE